MGLANSRSNIGPQHKYKQVASVFPIFLYVWGQGKTSYRQLLWNSTIAKHGTINNDIPDPRECSIEYVRGVPTAQGAE